MSSVVYHGIILTLNHGHASMHAVKVGQTNFGIIMPEKFVYHPEIEKCRDGPFNQLLAEKMSKHMFQNCMYPCRSKDGYCKLEIPLDNLPLCQNKAELECFLKSKWASKKEIGRENLFEPCTLIQYKCVQKSQTKQGHIQDDVSQAAQGNSQRGILDL